VKVGIRMQAHLGPALSFSRSCFTYSFDKRAAGHNSTEALQRGLIGPYSI